MKYAARSTISALRAPALDDDALVCPRCRTAVLDPRSRADVTIDVCRSCRGIWLDRGELETLTARAIVAARYADELEDDDDEELLSSSSAQARRHMIAAINGWRA